MRSRAGRPSPRLIHCASPQPAHGLSRPVRWVFVKPRRIMPKIHQRNREPDSTRNRVSPLLYNRRPMWWYPDRWLAFSYVNANGTSRPLSLTDSACAIWVTKHKAHESFVTSTYCSRDVEEVDPNRYVCDWVLLQWEVDLNRYVNIWNHWAILRLVVFRIRIWHSGGESKGP